MNAPKGDPTYIKNKDKYFISIAKAVELASSHPKSPGGCILVRDREIIGDGRSILTASKVEVDCITYAIATCSKRGTPTTGSTVYSTRYPFSASVFQCYLMGIKKIVVLAHEWEAYYKDEFRRAARLARELSMAIEPFFTDDDTRFSTNTSANRKIDHELYSADASLAVDEYDHQDETEILDDKKPTL
jgi:deoxycytidylate deaminase